MTDITQVVEQFSNIAQYAGATDAAAASNNLDILGKSIGAGIAMMGCLGVGISAGYAVGSAAIAAGRNPDAQPKIMNTMIVGMSVAESSAIFALIVAILIIFVA